MALDQRSEEDERKRREAFERNKAQLGLGANSRSASIMGASALAQAAPKAPVVQPAQVSPQIATNIASSQRAQNIAQQRQMQTQQRATRDADVLAARQNAQKVIGLPAAQQPQAVRQLKSQAPVQKSNYQPSRAGDVALGAAQAGSYVPQAMFAGTNALTGGKLSELAKSGNIHPQNFRDNLEQFKTTNTATAVKPVMGMVPPPNSIARPVVANAVAKSVADTVTPSQSLLDDDARVTNPIYAEGVTRGNPDNKKFGVSVDNNAAVAQPIAQPIAPTMGGSNSSFNFGVMGAPRKAYGEDSRRAAIRMDIKPYKGMNGRLTTGQIALNDAIRKGDDEKYANEQYTTQMNTAQKLAQEGMTQSGANSRAQLTERGATSRAELNERAAGERQANQLGFDSEKFQQTLAQDNRRLNMQQSNDQINNYGVKKLNEFREAWLDAKSPEEKTAIEQQMAILNAGSKGDSKPIVINQTGQTATGDQMGTTVDNPAMLYDPNTKEFINLPTAERAPNDPPMQALQQSGKYTKEQKGEIYDIYMNGGDISSYLE